MTHRRAAKWLLLTVVALGLAACDQWSKHWASTTLRLDHAGSMSVFGGHRVSCSLTFVRNPGAAWGMLANTSESFRRPFFFVVSIIAMAFILYMFVRVQPGQLLLSLALSAVMGGAIGNFIDRTRLHYVVDFIDIRVANMRWPTFNIADVAISAGVVMLMLEMMIGARRTRRGG